MEPLTVATTPLPAAEQLEVTAVAPRTEHVRSSEMVSILARLRLFTELCCARQQLAQQLGWCL